MLGLFNRIKLYNNLFQQFNIQAMSNSFRTIVSLILYMQNFTDRTLFLLLFCRC